MNGVTQPKCKQCGMIHPPVSEGDVCPMVKVENDKERAIGIFLILLRKHLNSSDNPEKEIGRFRQLLKL